MITPLVSEKEWLNTLLSLEEWQPPHCRTVILSPHPDDETLGVGGLLTDLCQAGNDVHVIAITDGENAYADEPELAAIRQEEQTQALKKLGLLPDRIHRLRIPDSAVTQSKSFLEETLIPLIDEKTHLIAPWTGDFHPDHVAAGQVAEKLAKQCGAKLSFYFFWTWHCSLPETIKTLSLRRYPLSSETLDTKLQALACHHSQLIHSSGEPILPDYLLESVQRPFEVYLPL